MVPDDARELPLPEKGDALWFGGGADLTPYYLFREDAVHFHRTLADACDRHRPSATTTASRRGATSTSSCPHRSETRGVGGVFFDYLGAKGEHPTEEIFAFVRDLGAFRRASDAYLPIVAAPATPSRTARPSGRGSSAGAAATSSST